MYRFSSLDKSFKSLAGSSARRHCLRLEDLCLCAYLFNRGTLALNSSLLVLEKFTDLASFFFFLSCLTRQSESESDSDQFPHDDISLSNKFSSSKSLSIPFSFVSSFSFLIFTIGSCKLILVKDYGLGSVSPVVYFSKSLFNSCFLFSFSFKFYLTSTKSENPFDGGRPGSWFVSVSLR